MRDGPSLSEEDVGKPVFNDGERVGTVSSVRGHRVTIDPDPAVTDSMMAKIGWREATDDVYPVHEDAITEITDDEVKLG